MTFDTGKISSSIFTHY